MTTRTMRTNRTGIIEFKDISPDSMRVTNDAQGIVEGLMSKTGNIDFQDDRVMPGAWRDTIKAAYARKAAGDPYLVPFLWSHNFDALPPGGVYYLDETREGLFAKVQMNRDIQSGRELWASYAAGTVSKQSIGYRTITSDYEKIEGKTIRNLRACELLECSAVVFPANPLATVSSVKRYWPGYSAKGQASGKTTWPLASRATSWDKGQATRDIQAYATSGDGEVNWSKAAQCYFWVATSPPEKWGDCKFPFVAKVGGEMKAVPAAIFNGAARLSSAQIDDVENVKKKMAAYYHQMDMKAPWEPKGNAMSVYTKDTFDEYYASEQIEDWLTADFGNVVSALRSAIADCFTEGGDPEANLESAVLPMLADALRAYVQQGAALGYTGSSPSGYGMVNMMGMTYDADTKSGYLNASDHAAIKESSQMIMKHAKIIASASARVDSANARARANALQGYPVYSGASDRSYFEEKALEEEALARLRMTITGLEVDEMVRISKQEREESRPSLTLGVEAALAAYLNKSNSRAQNTRASSVSEDELTTKDKLRIERMNTGL